MKRQKVNRSYDKNRFENTASKTNPSNIRNVNMRGGKRF